MLNFNDKNDEPDQEAELGAASIEENNSSESFKTTVTPSSRHRKDSTSSSTSLSTSDDEFTLNEIPVKGIYIYI